MTRLPTAGGHARAVPVARRACSVDTADVDRCGSALRRSNSTHLTTASAQLVHSASAGVESGYSTVGHDSCSSSMCCLIISESV